MRTKRSIGTFAFAGALLAGILHAATAQVITTPAAMAWQKAPTSYPPQWTWDQARTFDARPQSATVEMNLTPKVEQVRGGKVIATYTTLGGEKTCGMYGPRADKPGTPASQACGPFGQSQSATTRRVMFSVSTRPSTKTPCGSGRQSSTSRGSILPPAVRQPRWPLQSTLRQATQLAPLVRGSKLRASTPTLRSR